MPKKDPLKSKRIFVGFNSAGAAGIWAYTRILRRRGYQIDFYGLENTYFDMPVDFLLKFSTNPLISLGQRIVYFFKILPRYDIWHLNFMEGFFFYPLNLLILKLWGKKIILTVRGIEAQTDLDFLPKSIFSKSTAQKWPEYYQRQFLSRNFLPNILKKIRRQVFIMFADKVILTGPFLVSSVSRYDAIIPYARSSGKIENHSQLKTKITVLHVPSDSVTKGTPEIVRVFKILALKYPQHSFQVLPKMPREKLQKELAKADIVIDQLIVGWYGGQAVEAMALGKMVMAFLNPTYFQLVFFGAEIPIWNTNVWTFGQDLETLIKIFPQIRDEATKKSIQFVRKYHDSSKIAEKYLTMYRELYE